MKTVGLIAEYNPFHNGHRYHIEQAKAVSGADTAVVVMSGNFVQRGEPALTDKYTRAAMALACGADIVIELPMLYSCASAERFAFGAVGILHFLGADSLCFGSECADIVNLSEIAGILSDEPDGFRIALKGFLAEGDSFPKARQKAIEAYLNSEIPSRIISGPNNLLGIEYIKALRRYNSDMELYTVKRLGQDYNGDEEYDGGFASAACIRRMISDSSPDYLHEAVIKHIPEEAAGILCDAVGRQGAITADDFSDLLNYKICCLMREDSTQLLNYSDVSEPLANKITGIYGKEHFAGKWTELVMKLKSRDLTYSRISRALLHILLDIKKDAWHAAAPYARILGTAPKGRAFAASVRKTCTIPIITKAADDAELLRNDIFAADIYNQVVFKKSKTLITDDYRHPLVMI